MKRKILIVDDDVEILRLLKVKLDGTGRFDVLQAAGGREAVQKVRELAPDIVVCDIDMPDLDGGNVAAELAEDKVTSAVPLIFLSALVSPSEAIADEVGGWPMISKRTPFKDLLERIDQTLSDQTVSDQTVSE